MDCTVTGTFKRAMLKQFAEWLNQTSINTSVLLGMCSYTWTAHTENGWYVMNYVQVIMTQTGMDVGTDVFNRSNNYFA